MQFKAITNSKKRFVFFVPIYGKHVRMSKNEFLFFLDYSLISKSNPFLINMLKLSAKRGQRYAPKCHKFADIPSLMKAETREKAIKALGFLYMIGGQYEERKEA